MDLTDRQKDLLKAIIEIYVKSGDPVGSENIEKNYNLGVSSATIRNEMVKLTDLGYLKQPHTSAGRIPTSIGYRIYIQELMKEKEIPVSAEVGIKENIWQNRYQENRLVREAVKALAYRCQMLALAVNEDGDLFYAGAANILDFPEFEDIDVTRFVLSLFDEYPTLQQIIGHGRGVDPLHILFGDEMEYEYLQATGFVFNKYQSRNNREGVIGVIGPARMNFPLVIPYVKYTSNMVEQALKSW
jgi:transcriptional regulator of heat shock response